MNDKLLDIKKAKVLIQTKAFCFTELQVQDIKQRGEQVMSKEDMEFLISLDLERPKLLIQNMENYDSVALFTTLKEARRQHMDGVLVLSSNLTNKDVLAIRTMGYFVEFIGPGDIGDEIYFTEDGLLRNRIFDFKNLFGDVKNFVESGVI